jgi:GNAT superfamily N-acetyltransferase
VTESGLDFRLLDGPQAAEYEPDLAALHAEIYADPPYQQPDDDNERFRARFSVQRRQPGFVLATAWHGGYLVGYATGIPLRPSTSWWRGLTTTVPDDVTAEHPGRTFALTELSVRASWRRQGIGRALHDLVLGGREEERATVAVLPAATAAQQAFRQWGWHKVARSADPRPGPPAPGALIYDILVRTRRSA